MAKCTDDNKSAPSGHDGVEGISEINILPDGRVYVLGYSEAIQAAMERADLVNERALTQQPSRQAEQTELQKKEDPA